MKKLIIVSALCIWFGLDAGSRAKKNKQPIVSVDEKLAHALIRKVLKEVDAGEYELEITQHTAKLPSNRNLLNSRKKVVIYPLVHQSRWQ